MVEISNRHYHFYCDESGEFEKNTTSKKRLVFGLLVPDQDRTFLAEQYQVLKNKYLSGLDRVHGKDLFLQADYQTFIDKLVTFSCQSSIKMVSIRYKRDIYEGAPGDIEESIACNRYLYMIQSLIESILFFHPPFWGDERVFTFRHNTRVFPVKDQESAEKLKLLGYHIFNTEREKNILATVWDTKGFMIFLKRVLVDFSPFIRTTGFTHIAEAEMQRSAGSNDPFVSWVDNLAGAFLWGKDKFKEKIRSRLEIDLEYGEQHARYRNLSMNFLESRLTEFLPELFKNMGKFNQYYERQLDTMIDRAFEQLIWDVETLERIAHIVRDHVERSSGQWELVLKITEKLIGQSEKLEDKSAISATIRRLKVSRLSCLNHRGDVDSALALFEGFKTEACVTIDDLREKAEIMNRFAITGANRFDFIIPSKALIPYIERLDKSRLELSKEEADRLKDPQIGRIASTLGQSLAFYAPIQNEYFPAAEKFFTIASGESVHPDDILRQSVYLAHLYLDFNRTAAAIHRVQNPSGPNDEFQCQGTLQSIIQSIIERPDISSFIRSPSQKKIGAMSFVLSLLLKYEIETGDKIFPEPIAWTSERISATFPFNKNEHPFQLIWLYLAQKALKNKSLEQAEVCFQKALSIPTHTRDAPPVIKAIHCRILGCWADWLIEIGKNDLAKEKITTIMDVMNQIAEKPQNKTIITKEGGGWFGPEIKNIEKALTHPTLIGAKTALSDFLGKFTFNYR